MKFPEVKVCSASVHTNCTRSGGSPHKHYIFGPVHYQHHRKLVFTIAKQARSVIFMNVVLRLLSSLPRVSILNFCSASSSSLKRSRASNDNFAGSQKFGLSSPQLFNHKPLSPEATLTISPRTLDVNPSLRQDLGHPTTRRILTREAQGSQRNL
jgi:hypothetical protein